MARGSYATDLLPSRRRQGKFSFIWKYLLLHLLAAFYLALCYMCALKPVFLPFKTAPTPEEMGTYSLIVMKIQRTHENELSIYQDNYNYPLNFICQN